MAKLKAVEKTEEVKEEKRRPDFVVRAKQSPQSEFWQTIGAAWSADINGKTGYSVKLHLVPTDWDGSFLLMPPLESGE